MSLENVAEGWYSAKILDYGVYQKEGKLPQLSIKFEIMANGQPENITWYGHLSPKAKPYTMKSLALMGLTNPKAIETFGMGIASGLLNSEGEYSIKVNLETYEGKVSRKVGWIGIAKAGGNNYMAEGDSLNALKSLNLVADATVAVLEANNGKLPNGEVTYTGEDVGF